MQKHSQACVLFGDTYQAVAAFLYQEARLADEARYAEWLALWTDDGVYWVPATTDPGANPDRHLSHIYDNRTRLETRIKLLQTGVRYSQEPASTHAATHLEHRSRDGRQ